MSRYESSLVFKGMQARVGADVINAGLASAYQQAAHDGLDMRLVADSIESARERTSHQDDPFAMALSFQHRAASEPDQLLASVLVEASRSLRSETSKLFSRHLKKTGAGQDDRDWLAMLSTSIAAWDATAVRAVLSAKPKSRNLRDVAGAVRKSLPALVQNRWTLTVDMLEAMAEVDGISDVHRSIFLAWLGLVKLYFEGSMQRSRDLIDQAWSTHQNPEVASAQADYWLFLRRNWEARSILTSALSRWPEHSDLYRAMADVEIDEGDFLVAERWFALGEDSSSEGPIQLGNLAKRRIENGSYEGDDEPESLFERLVLISHDYRAINAAETSFTFYDNDDNESGLRWARKALEYDARIPFPHVALGIGLLHDDRESALASFKRAAEADSLKRGDVALEIGKRLSKADIHDEAVEWLHKAVTEADGMSILPMHRQELADVELKDDPEARRQVMVELLREVPDGQALFPLLDIADEASPETADRQYREVESIVDQVLKFYPRNALGNMAQVREDYSEAVSLYESALESDPDNPVVFRNLAGSLSGLGEWERAEKAVEDAFKIDGLEDLRDQHMASTHNLHGNSLFHEERYEESVKWYQQAAVADPTEPVYHGNLGGAHAAIKAPGKRKRSLRKAVRAYHNAVNAGGDEYRDQLETVTVLSEGAAAYGEGSLDWVPLMAPLRMDLGSSLVPHTADLDDELLPKVAELIDNLREKFIQILGVSVPPIRFREDLGLPDNAYRGFVFGEPLAYGTIDPDQRAVRGPGRDIEELGIEATTDLHPFTGEEIQWVDAIHAGSLTSDFDVWPVPFYAIFDLMGALLVDLKAFVGYEDTAGWLSDLGDHPIVGQFETVDSRAVLTRVLNGLVAEQVTIEPFAEICEVVASGLSRGASITEMTEHARSAPRVREGILGPQGKDMLHPLDPSILDLVRRGVAGDGDEPIIAMTPSDFQTFDRHFQELLDRGPIPTIVVADSDLRPHVRKLAEIKVPRINVVSTEEVDRHDAMLQGQPG